MRVKMAVTMLLGVAMITACRQHQSIDDVDEQIHKSTVLSDIDQLCRDLPRPESFRLTGKTISGNSRLASISYDFESPEQYADASTFFTERLRQDGWQIGPSGRFEKGRYQVALDMVHFPEANYSVYCAEAVL